ncbi:sodium/glutamate symporter [Nesterenkonia alkaliphila]|uniref:Sodium:glutamate symporter n=1 Tax=Nesterenkonia alkaliphila TaxID=1463631 RepID=A0A7K1UGH4_9MICC|nr:sodium/glutamate symporter [Nesterenkonia alkaliphila]MVT25573.1 sodium:glutamate symporter [Nesterenkonia alkaliphila]GFZ95087.1 sodium:glutamate symporter [Nesterenkonia alkaliphila]
MPDITEIDGAMLNSLLVSISILGLLLLVGVVLRLLIPGLRKFFIPAALIGGLLGLSLGPHALDVVPGDMTSTWGALAGLLIAIVFAPMLLGQELPGVKQAAKEAGPHIFYSYFSSFAIIAVPALMTFFIFQPFFNTNALFSTIFEVSWPGGHGTAAGMEEAYQDLGWQDGSSLGLGAATFGLVFGIIAGMIMLNIAARRGHLVNYTGTAVLTDSDILKDSAATQESRSRLRKASLDNLAFHFSLIGAAIIIGYVLKHFVDMVITGVPLFPLAMIGGLIVHLAIRPTPMYKLVDKSTLNSIAGIALDFLVVAAVASISIPVVLENWVALLATMIVVALLSIGIFYIIGPRIFREHWVENSIVNFGAMTGVVSVGLLLLRAADPQMKTNAYRGFALRAPFTSPFVGGGIITALFPILVAQHGNLWIGLGCLAACLLLIGLAMLLGIWQKPSVRKESA